MAHSTSNAGGPTDKRRSGKHGAYDPRFVQRGEKINPQSKENFSSSFLIRGVVLLNVGSGVSCESQVESIRFHDPFLGSSESSSGALLTYPGSR